MRTIKPISTISYNTDEFLIKTLNQFITERIIDFWAFINHLPEDDEKKAHKHVFMHPCSLVDTFALQDRLQEVDITNPDKPPLGCMEFDSSKFVHWYLYVVHDKDYLISKRQSRRYHYQRSEIIVSDSDFFSRLIHQSDFSTIKSFSNFRDDVLSGVAFRDLVKNGFVPVQQIFQYRGVYNILRHNDIYYEDRTNRGGRQGHEPMSGGGGSFQGVPFMGTRGEPAQGELLYNDFDHFTDRVGEIHTMYPVYDDVLPFDVDSEIEKNPPKN